MNRLRYGYITVGGVVALATEFFSNELLSAGLSAVLISGLPRVLWMIAVVLIGIEFGYRKGKGKGGK